MASEKLTIELEAKTAKLNADLKKVDGELNDLGESVDGVDGKFKKFGGATKIAGNVLLGLGAAAATAITTITALSKTVAAYSREIRIASDLSGVAAEELQIMAHATSTVGIDMEKLGDISKDTREKIGDFLNTGGGGFMDFVDAMKLTEKEATKLAKEFSTLTGPEILQRMVTMMEDAGVSAVQMSHALEGMASDATRLIPLMADGGKKAKDLADSFSSVVIPLSESDIDMFIRMGESADLAGASLKSLGEQILVDLGDAFIKAANKVAFFYASLNEGTEAQKTKRLAEIKEEIEQTEETYKRMDNWFNKAIRSEESFLAQQEEGLQKIKKLEEERAQIHKELAKSRFGIGEDPEKPKIEEDGDSVSSLKDKEEEKLNEWLTRKEELQKEAAERQRQREIEAIESRWMTEEEKLHEKYEKELEIIGEHNENKLALEDEYIQNLMDLDAKKEAEKNKANKDSLKNTEKRLKMEQQLEMQNAKSILSIMSSLVDSESKIGKALFLGTQALALAETFVNTQAASIKALTLDPTGALSAKVQLQGALSMAAIGAATIGSLAGGGGGSTGGTSIGSTSTPSIQSEPDFVQDTAQLQLTDSTTSGSGTNEIRFATDSGDELVDAIANALNKGQREGRF